MLYELTAMLGLLVMGDPVADPVGGGVPFEDWFCSARRGDLELPAPVARKACGYRYVFVGGFRNERIPGYFAQNMAELRVLGVPRGSIHVIYPSSVQTAEQNAGEVRARFLEIAGEGPEKLVVIAHSRGACDTLAFAIANAGFVGDRVEALFLVQGPFGGSGLAEYALGRGEPMDRRIPWRDRILGKLAGCAMRLTARGPGRDVLEGMTREASRAFWVEALARHAGAAETIGPRTFYVRSQIEPSRLHFARRAIAWYLRIHHGPGDGMVALADQMLPAVGTVVATLEAGHADLTQRFPASRAPKAMRRALIRSILMAVGQPAARVTDRGPTTSEPAQRVGPRRLMGLFPRKPGASPAGPVASAK